MIKLNSKNALIDQRNFDELSHEVLKIKREMNQFKHGFMDLPYQFDLVHQEIEYTKELLRGKNTIVIIGIGGSDLGARAINQVFRGNLKNENGDLKVYFAGDTTDPDIYNELDSHLDYDKTLFVVISKSGNTVEQSVAFIYFRNKVIENLSKEQEINHFLFITDPVDGFLRELSMRYGYKSINLPQNVGGRFSVLSSVGMVFAGIIGCDVEKILNGAKDLDAEFKRDDIDDVARFSIIQYLHYRSKRDISVLMPYRYNLKEFGRWYAQLISESLGKKHKIDSAESFEGITPQIAIGPYDQHSQLQLFNEGPDNKLIIFIESEKVNNDIHLPSEIEFAKYQNYKQRSLFEILKLSKSTTEYSLTKNGRPNVTITIDELNEYHLGQLFYFFELSTVIIGGLLRVDPFNQPGVELSKRAMNTLLGIEVDKDILEDFGKINT